MDAIELLTADHNKVREWFKRFNGGSGIAGLVRRTIGSVPRAERQKARARVCEELEMHTRVEEQVFYPAVKALGDSTLNDQLAEALAEHRKVKNEIAQLRSQKGDDADVAARMGQLEKDVEHHASEEEEEMFPRLKELMPEKERQDLARRMRELKRGAASSPSRARRTTQQAKSRARPRKTTRAVVARRKRKTTAGPSAARGKAGRAR